jgi:16S rRNA processing protein RimM
VLGPHGVRGELACRILTDFPERFARTRELLLGDPPVSRRVERQRVNGDTVLLKLAGIDDRTTAEQLRGALLSVPLEAAVELPPGAYFWHEIIGLRVEQRDGELVGRVVDVLATGSNDVYIVDTPRGELLLPAIKDVVLQIDRARGVMTVELIPGLAP